MIVDPKVLPVLLRPFETRIRRGVKQTDHHMRVGNVAFNRCKLLCRRILKSVLHKHILTLVANRPFYTRTHNTRDLCQVLVSLRPLEPSHQTRFTRPLRSNYYHVYLLIRHPLRVIQRVRYLFTRLWYWLRWLLGFSDLGQVSNTIIITLFRAK